MERLSDLVKCLICGFELSGTTALSELVRHHPRIDGRFEVGRLLFDSVSDYKASVYRPFLKQYWNVDDSGEAYVFGAETLRNFYERLIERSSVRKDIDFIYDKTPRYMLHLEGILERTDLPCLVNVRDPRALFFSMKTRHPELELEAFFEHFESYANGYLAAAERFSERICLVRNEDLCTRPVEEGERVFRFLGLEFDPSYAKLERKWRLHTNVRGALGPARMLRFKGELSESEERRILERLARHGQWFYEDEVSREFLTVP